MAEVEMTDETDFDEMVKRFDFQLSPMALHEMRIGFMRIRQQAAELKKWSAEHPESDLQELKEQAKNGRSLAAMQAYINALEFHLAHAQEQIKILNCAEDL
jgi:hypothetical protein